MTRINSGGLLSEKQFVARNSILSELFELKHIRTIYNIFIVILIILFLNTAVHDILTTGKLNLGLDLIMWNFEKPHVWILIWCSMMFSTIILYVAFSYWALWRVEVSSSSVTHRCLGYLGFFSLLAYELLLLILPAYYICKYDLHPAASLALLLEQIRLLMKVHAFVRSNLRRTLTYKNNNKDKQSLGPKFSSFLYFMFAPTLIYRDNYPRTRETRWRVVAFHFAEVGGTMFYITLILERFLIPMFRDFGLHPTTADKIMMAVFGTLIPAKLGLVCFFYCLLHSWMNAFAEILKFADRMFYKDWWNATSYAVYFRTWNIVVHDWLYTYIYKDISENFEVKHYSFAKILVFLISAVVHEYILAFTLNFFCPYLLFLFGGFGTFSALLPQNLAVKSNIVFWLSQITGMGILTSGYCFEYYARINCVRTEDSFIDFFIPRSWNCVRITIEN